MRGLAVAALLVAVYFIAARLYAFLQYILLLRAVQVIQQILQ